MSPVTIPAALTDDVAALVSQPAQLFEILEREQRPIAISVPRAVAEAATEFSTALDELDINYRVYAAHKATNSQMLIGALQPHVGIDVASPAELENAIRAGYRPHDIIATGPKSDYFLRQLTKLKDIVVSVDSYSELERLLAITGAQPVAVLLRLTRSLLNPTGMSKKSRFGLDAASLDRALTLLQGHATATLRGIAYHLDTQSVSDKQAAARKAIDILLDISNRGFDKATVLDIGGGFGTGYGVDQAASHAFEAAVRESLTSDNGIAWQQYSYGVHLEDGLMRGELSGINLPRDVWGVARLRELLHSPDQDGITLAEYVNEYLIEIWCEPGMTLVSSAGMLAAQVVEVTERDGESMILVDAHRNQLCFEGLEHGSDPLLLSQRPHGARPACDAYLIGHLCTETDFIVNRKVHFPHAPQAGDVLLWTHTGGYQMYFSASQAIGHPLPAAYTLTDTMTLKEEKV